MKAHETRYKLNCPKCGEQFLTIEQYTQQFVTKEHQWTCPSCGRQDAMMWDEDWNNGYDEAMLKAYEIAEERKTLKVLAACVCILGAVVILVVFIVRTYA